MEIIYQYQVSDGLFDYLSADVTLCPTESLLESSHNMTEDLSMQILNTTTTPTDCSPEVLYTYTSLQYAFFTNCGVEVVGGILFLITAIFIVRDKLACEAAVSGSACEGGRTGAFERGVMLTQYSPEDSLGEEEDEEMIPQLKLLGCDSSEDSVSRSPSPAVC